MRSALEFVGLSAPGHRPDTRPRKGQPPRRSAVESLERREVMSGAGVPFASFPGAVAARGEAAQVVLHFDAGELTSDRSPSILLGLHARPTTGSSLVPNISGVEGVSGRLTRTNLPRRGPEAAAKSLFITSVPTRSGQAQDFSVDVAALNGKAGGFELDVFLPGDANGDSVVDATDLAIIDGIYGSAEGQSNFNPAADFNGDGHVGCIDLQLAVSNQGAHAAYSPVAPAATPTVTPPAATPPEVAPVAATTPVVATATVVTPAPVVATATVVTPAPVVTPTPVVTPAFAVTSAQVAPTPVQVGTSYAAVQATPTVIVPIQATPAVAPVYSQATTTSPAFVVPSAQATYPISGQTAPQAVLPTPVYYSQPASPPMGTVALSGQTPMTGVAYYYGQPVVQAPGSGQAMPAQATIPGPVYYLGQPVVQGPGYAQPTVPGTVYYYGQPSVQPTTTGQPAKP